MERILKSARESGSLNLSNRSLREVPGEVYNNLDTGSQDDKWWEGVDLQKLILAHNNLEVLREDLRNLSSLVVLNISHNNLSSLPAAIGDLPLLKSLDVSFNQINLVPEEIGLASALVKVDFSNNCLTELPVSLSKCLGLSELKASNNKISRVPDELANCCKLSRLDLEGNKLVILPENMFTSWTMLTELNAAKNLLTTIPDSIGALSKLIRLDLHQNKITSIPSSIKGCSSLAEFYMGNNLLSSIPADIGMLSKLGTLDLHSNQLKEYPVGACKLKLSFLDLSNNTLSGLPPELGTMTTLRKLLLSGNPMRTLRSSLVSGPTSALLKYLRSRLSSDEEASGSRSTPTKDDQIAAARRLSLSSKELSLTGLGATSVPPAAWEANDVVKLDLSKNSIEDLPNELSLCSSLQALVLSNNKIKRWPGMVLSSLPSLSSLKLDNNPLVQITSSDLEVVSKLEVLDLSGNASSLTEPSAVSSLPRLQELYLRRMKLNQFPIGLLGLKVLRILDLSQNYLTTVPEGIKDLSALIELDLSDNNITTLPAELISARRRKEPTPWLSTACSRSALPAGDHRALSFDHHSLPRILLSTAPSVSDLHAVATKLGVLPSSLPASNALISAYSLSGLLPSSLRAFSLLPYPSTASYTSILSALSRHDRPLEALSLFAASAVYPDVELLSCIVSCCRRASAFLTARAAHAFGIKNVPALAFYTSAGPALIALYAKHGKVFYAKRVFGFSDEEDVVSWNAMIGGFATSGRDSDALYCFRDMRSQGVRGNARTAVAVLGACDLESGRQVQGYMVRTQDGGSKSILCNALLSMYSRAGSVRDAERVFLEIEWKDVVSWNVMISAFANNGHAQRALELVDTMVRCGMKPDSMTFTTVLMACCHCGLVDEGLTLFQHFVAVIGLVPTMEQCACIVDLLASAGRFEEAVEFTNQMPMRPNAIVWGTLLSASRMHENVEFAQIAFEKLVQVEPENPGNFVTMSNIYAKAGMVEDAKRVRMMIDRKELVKPSGQSCV